MRKPGYSDKIIILAGSNKILPSMKNPYGSEEELLTAYLRHDPDAEKYIYDRGWRFAKNNVVKNNGSEEEAKDIFQDAMLLFYKKLMDKTYQKRKDASFFTFLNEISRRLWMGELKKKSRGPTRIPFPPDVKNSEKEDQEEQDARIKILHTALDQLDGTCREIIKLGYFEKLSHRQIAEILGYTEAYAKRKRHNCLKRLIDIYNTMLKKQGK